MYVCFSKCMYVVCVVFSDDNHISMCAAFLVSENVFLLSKCGSGRGAYVCAFSFASSFRRRRKKSEIFCPVGHPPVSTVAVVVAGFFGEKCYVFFPVVIGESMSSGGARGGECQSEVEKNVLSIVCSTCVLSEKSLFPSSTSSSSCFPGKQPSQFCVRVCRPDRCRIGCFSLAISTSLPLISLPGNPYLAVETEGDAKYRKRLLKCIATLRKNDGRKFPKIFHKSIILNSLKAGRTALLL